MRHCEAAGEAAAPCGEEFWGAAGEAAYPGPHGEASAGGGAADGGGAVDAGRAADAGGRVPPPLLFDGPPLSWGTPFPRRDMV